MSQACTVRIPTSPGVLSDPVTRLYLTAEAMAHLSGTLPEALGGLAHIIGTLAADVKSCACLLDDAED